MKRPTIRLFIILLFPRFVFAEFMLRPSGATFPEPFAPVETNAISNSPSMTEAEARAFCKAWLPHWVGGEKAVEKLLTFYTDDAIYEDPNVPLGVKGKTEVGNFLRVLLKKYPDWKFDIVAIFPTPKGFILQYNGTIPVETGATITNFRGVDIIDLENGKISKQQGFYDRHVFF